AVVEAEDLVVQIQSVHDDRYSGTDSDAGLRVHLHMRIEVRIAARTCCAAGGEVTRAQRRSVAIQGLILGRGDVRPVERKAQSRGQSAAIVSGTDIPGVRRLSEKRRMIGAQRDAARVRRRITVVGGQSEPAQRRWQEGQMLLITDFKALKRRAPGVAG